MSALAEAVLEALDDESLARLADRLRPFLAPQHGHALLAPADAAKRLSVHPKTLVRAARAGRVPGARRVGSGWRFDPDVLDLLSPATTTAPTMRPALARRTPTSTRAVDAIRGTGASR